MCQICLICHRSSSSLLFSVVFFFFCVWCLFRFIVFSPVRTDEATCHESLIWVNLSGACLRSGRSEGPRFRVEALNEAAPFESCCRFSPVDLPHQTDDVLTSVDAVPIVLFTVGLNTCTCFKRVKRNAVFGPADVSGSQSLPAARLRGCFLARTHTLTLL